MFQQFKNIYHLITALIFQAWYGLPARKLKVIGVTGTDGKTTTTSLIHHVLKTAGKQVSSITSVGAYIAGKQIDTGFHVTTPDPHEIPKYMAQAVKHGDEYFVLEITSHALDQHRIAGIQLAVAGITNITHEHLHYHKTFDSYVHAKSKIATYAQKTYINADQPEVAQKIRACAPKATLITFGRIQKADLSRQIETEAGIYLEEFNKYNFLLAYGMCRELGVPDEVFMQACQTFTSPPGRMEVLYDEDFTVVSDFAHTPSGLEAALPAVLQKFPHRSRLIHVFGAAAFRDDDKRPAMGRISATHANVIILTEEDYRTEDPERIFAMLAQGIEEKGFREIHPETAKEHIPNRCYMKILNREQAIAKAIEIAGNTDIIMITGKGVEKSLCRGKKEEPYDERAQVKKSITNRNNSTHISLA